MYVGLLPDFGVFARSSRARAISAISFFLCIVASVSVLDKRSYKLPPVLLLLLTLLLLETLLDPPYLLGLLVGEEFSVRYLLFICEDAKVSVLLILSQKLDPLLIDLPSLLALRTDLDLDEGLSFVSINPFLCAVANVSVYAIRSQNEFDVLPVRGVLLDLF